MILLAIDDHSLPWNWRQTAPDVLSPLGALATAPGWRCKPDVRREPVLTPSSGLGNPEAADHMVAHFYGTVLHDEGRYRMWYYAMNEVLPGGRERRA